MQRKKDNAINVGFTYYSHFFRWTEDICARILSDWLIAPLLDPDASRYAPESHKQLAPAR
jgi:hypothetical protein